MECESELSPWSDRASATRLTRSRCNSKTTKTCCPRRWPVSTPRAASCACCCTRGCRTSAGRRQGIPGFNIVLSKSVEEEPPAQPVVVGKTIIVNVGHKGRYVGVVGVFFGNNPDAPEMHYQLVPLGEDFETDDNKVKEHPAIDKLEEYARQLKDLELWKKFPKTQHPTQVAHKGQRVAFVGSDKCAACHAAEYKTWKETKHSHAFEALTDHAVKPSLRQFDGECIVCHTVGFQFAGGFVSEQKTPHLKHVGCENCHGPGELHVSQPTNPAFRKDMSPWKSAAGRPISGTGRRLQRTGPESRGRRMPEVPRYRQRSEIPL